MSDIRLRRPDINSPLRITGERPSGPVGKTAKLKPHRTSVSAQKLSLDLRNLVRLLQDPNKLGEYFPKAEGWEMEMVESDSVPGLGGGGIRVRREYTRSRVAEVIFGRDANAMIFMPEAGFVGAPISSVESIMVAPFGDDTGNFTGVTRAKPVKEGYLALTAVYDEKGKYVKPVGKFQARGQEQSEPITEGIMGDEGEANKKIVLKFGDDSLVLGGLPEKVEIGQLLGLINNEVSRVLAEAEVEAEGD